MSEAKYRDPLDIITEGRTLPDGYDSWGVKSVGFDGRTKHGYLWPAPGYATERLELDPHESSCPKREGDGLCVATSWKGMASGGYRAFCILLVAYRSSEARGNETKKLRVPQVFVVDRLDGEKIVRESFAGADLYGAYLSGADLRGADLHDANLHNADLRYANLRSAYLSGADLHEANLYGAYLSGADLRYANLHNADLHDANLRYANLSYADLRSANLRGASLRGAYLRGADLRDAILPDGWSDETVRERGGIR